MEISDVKNYCKVDTNADDNLLTRLMASAAARIETDTGLRLTPQSFQKVFANLGEKCILPVWPVNSVTSIKIGARDVSSYFDIDLTKRPATFYNIGGLTLAQGERLEIICNVGFFDVPQDLIDLQLQMIAHRYENREGALPADYETQIKPYRTLRLS